MLVTFQTCGAKWNSMLRPVVFMQLTSFLLCWLVTCLLYVYSHLKFNKTNIKNENMENNGWHTGWMGLGFANIAVLPSVSSVFPFRWECIEEGQGGFRRNIQGACPHLFVKGNFCMEVQCWQCLSERRNRG